MKKSTGIATVLSIIAISLSAAALAVSIIALIRGLGKNRMNEGEYDFCGDIDGRSDYGDISDDDDIGSDTLAF